MATNKKFLIVEDEANLLYGLQAKLRVEGYDTITDDGTDKADIMEKIKTLKPDYAVIDIILPRVNGFDLLAEIKANPLTSNIPVFIFTNLSDADSRAKGEKLGADFYFIKTEFNLDEFVAKIKKIIANKEKII